MLDNTRDINRDPARQDAYLNDPAVGEGSGYGPIVALAAIAVIIGGLFFFAPRGDQQVASNSPAVERTTPTPAPAPVTPAPATKAPAAPQQ